MEIGRNSTCPCGSGKKYRKCCDVAVRPSGYSEDDIDTLKLNKWMAYKGKVGRKRSAFCNAYIKNKYLVIRAIEEKQLEETRSKGRTLSCQPGCVYCCYYYVTATLDEVEPIVYYLYHHEKPLNDFLANYRNWKAKTDENQALMADIPKAYNTFIADRASREKQEHFQSLTSEYLALDIPCPFLDNGACSVYPVRPWGCVCFVSVTPPEWCRPDSPHQPDTKSMPYYSDMHKVPHYHQSEEVWLTMPEAVYSILKGGVYSLSGLPGLETLERETLEDPEMKHFLRGLRVI